MIGVFDSGLGGLTALKEIRALLPWEDFVYFGDTGRVPYGTRTPQTVAAYAAQDVRFLLTFEPQAILAACGTVSSTAIDCLRATFDLPVFGVVEAAAEAALRATRNGKIGVIGTAATVSSGAYKRVLCSVRENLQITQIACPLFVPLVENGFTAADDPITRLACEHYLAPIREQECDTLILGCTHYPIIAQHIAAVLPGVRLINSGAESARALCTHLSARIPAPTAKGTVRYFVSDNAAGFAEQAHLFLGERVSDSVCQIDIASY